MVKWHFSSFVTFNNCIPVPKWWVFSDFFCTLLILIPVPSLHQAARPSTYGCDGARGHIRSEDEKITRFFRSTKFFLLRLMLHVILFRSYIRIQ